MPEFCTCGAQLPPEALFCHKCGKPQRELQAPEREIREAEPVAFRPTGTRGAEPPLNFRNRAAVRIAFIVAAVTTLLSWVPVVNLILWAGGAGFFAVFLYRRRTGYLLSIRAGVRLGGITGVMTSLIMAAIVTAIVIPMTVSENIAARFESQLKSLPASDPNVQQALQLVHILQAGPAVAVLLSVAGSMLLIFIFITCLSMAGGALGAKIAGGNQ
jgi:hypothetical protein